MQVTQVIANLRAQDRTLSQAQDAVRSAIKVLEAAVPEAAPAKKGKGRGGKKRKKMSAEAREKIAAAAKARWAEKRKAEGK